MSAPKMDPKVKARWVEALRSGKYGQGVGMLRDKDGHYCCLGVLCEVTGWEYEPVDAFPDDHDTDAAGVSGEATGVLARMNDSGKRFADIADYIEANL